jgi:peptide/nickel transport system permease protein
MGSYILRRLLQAVPTLFGITLISFLLMQAAPGDPIGLIMFNPSATPEAAQMLRRQLGLDQPPLMQYIYWLAGNDWMRVDLNGDGTPDSYGTRQGFLRGDLGQSLQQKQPVLGIIAERIPATLQLSLTALLVGYLLGITIGVFSAVYHRGWFDQFVRVLAVIGNAVPGFWLALMMIITFSVNLRWLPMGGMRDVTSGQSPSLLESLRYMVMPVTVLSLGTMAVVSRYMRMEVLEVLGQDYVRTAYSKGLSRGRVLWGHALRNALIPVATLLGPALGSLLSGAVIIEQVFGWPGMGRLVVSAVFQRDYPVVMGSVVMGAVLFIIGLLISDLLYTLLDPRIRLN